MLKKVIIYLLVIYTGIIVLVLPSIYSSSSAYAVKPNREVLLSSLVDRKEIYWKLMAAKNLTDVLVAIIKRLYPDSILHVPEDLFRVNELLAYGVRVDVLQQEKKCRIEQLDDYRQRAKVSLWYSPLVFSPTEYKIVARFPLETEPTLAEDYPLMMLFTANSSKKVGVSMHVDVFRCDRYLVFSPEEA